MLRLSMLCTGFLLATLAGAAWAQSAPRKVPGDVVRFASGVLEIRTASGAEMKSKLTDRTRITFRAASDLSQIRPGSYVGATAAPRADGTLVASEVHIFPDSMRGMGEGHRPMSDGNTMTNATVTGVSGGAPRSTMTNATVASIAPSGAERRLVLTYKDGEKAIIVPSGTPVMTYGEGNPSLLVPGAHVIVYASAQSDGTLIADRITVGKDGYVPPI